MHLDAGAVQRHCFDLDLHHLCLLQLCEGSIEHARLGPAAHAGVDRVPVAEALRQATPFSTVFSDVQDRVEHLQIGQADVAALLRQTVFDLGELSWGDLHNNNVARNLNARN